MQYSPARRTAIVLCGTGAHGAYHAGVLRALHEAGVKIDVMAGRGVGVGAALLVAADGGPRLWEAAGPWHGASSHDLYRWTAHARLVFGLTCGTLAVVGVLLALFLAGAMSAPAPAVAMAASVAVGGAVVLAFALASWRSSAVTRRSNGAWWWLLLGAPIDPGPARRLFVRAVWQLIGGGASTDAAPAATVLGRRYAEVLAENVGQPGCRELMIVATDLDARADVVAALLSEPYRGDFIAPRPGRERRAEVLDLAGSGRDHALDVLAGALTPPVACEPWPITFAADGYWRGETHRLCDRPESIIRLLEELSAAGVSQVVIVTAVEAAAVPHRLRAISRTPRGRLGEFVTAAEAAALHDALSFAQLRFDACYVIRPSHNPVGPFDVAGAYDEASDRRHSTEELMEGGYEDAYHQFIEPVVGASGEQLPQLRGRAVASTGHTHAQGLFDDPDP